MSKLNYHKFKHFIWNKYFISPISFDKYFISYNYKYKTIWFRTYKVASRTIRGHFEANSEAGQDIYSSEVGYLPASIKNYYKFAFVRNPMDKFISAYKDKVLRNNYFKFPPPQYTEMQKLEKFLDWLEVQDLRTMDEHFRPQFLMVNVNNLDFLGRFENFQEDFSKLCSTVGLPVFDFPKKNRGNSKEMPIDDNMKRRIKALYEMDFRVFYPGYL